MCLRIDVGFVVLSTVGLKFCSIFVNWCLNLLFKEDIRLFCFRCFIHLLILLATNPRRRITYHLCCSHWRYTSFGYVLDYFSFVRILYCHQRAMIDPLNMNHLCFHHKRKIVSILLLSTFLSILTLHYCSHLFCLVVEVVSQRCQFRSNPFLLN